MYRFALLAVLLLAVAVAAAGSRTVACSLVSSYTVNSTERIDIFFDFKSIAPALPGSGVQAYRPALPPHFTRNASYVLVFSPVRSVRWNMTLEFSATLKYYAPFELWRIDVYRCELIVNGTVRGVGHYPVVAATPRRVESTITFTVPPTANASSASAAVYVSRPIGGCASTPSADTWPSCPRFEPLRNTISVDYPDSWRALEVNGRRPGEVVTAYGVNATIPNPWEYGIYSPDITTISYVESGGRRYEPRIGDIVMASPYVRIHMVGVPKMWGVVKLRGASAPVYVPRVVKTVGESPFDICRPPSCLVMDWKNATKICEPPNYRGPPYYLALVTVRSGVTAVLNATFYYPSAANLSEVRLPLGSVHLAHVNVRWRGTPLHILGDPYLRVVVNNTYYEAVARYGKVKGPLNSTRAWKSCDIVAPGFDICGYSIPERPVTNKTATVAFAVDGSVRSIGLGWYAWPVFLYTNLAFGRVYDWAGYMRLCPTGGFRVYLASSLWLTDILQKNRIGGGRHPDLLHVFYGEPTVYRGGNQRGVVYVHTDRRETRTTSDDAGLRKLHYVTGIAPTDALMGYIISLPQHHEGGGGGGGGGGDGDDGPGRWLVWVVPTAACRSMFCTVLRPELVGPLPPFPGDRALPNMGYSFMLMYIGDRSRHRVSVYVEDGYVISSGFSLTVSRVRSYKLVEIDKVWEPFEAVIVGPGWWVPYRQLDTCRTMPLNVSSIYAAPDRLGPVKITVEVNRARYNYTFYVTSDVKYRITTRTPAPASLTATPFNITVRVLLGGVPHAYGLGGVLLRDVPYFHYIYGFGEGGRISPPTCTPTWFNNTYRAPQLVLSGDFWGSFGLANMPLKPVNIQYIYAKPRLELVEPWRGLVRLRADGPVAGFAFYAQRNGAWVKIGEAAGSCLLVNASRLFPWDPILVLPLVEQELTARPGDAVTIWRPATSLLFKTWADVVGYPKGARSVLEVVRTC